MVDVGGSQGAWERLGDIGRTEDVRFSPSNRRLAIAAFGRGEIALCDVEVGRQDGRASFDLRYLAAVPLGEGRRPHGLDWLDDETLVVADREGTVEVVRVTSRSAGAADLVRCELAGGLTAIKTPGSVRIAPGGGPRVELFVCNNYVGTVSHHVLERGPAGWSAAGSKRALEQWLDVPDGVAISADGRWLAVSNTTRTS